MDSVDRYEHVPVLAAEAIALLQPHPGGAYIDATVGGAGHADRILQGSSPDGTLVGIDADPEALSVARERLGRYGSRVSLTEAYYDDLASRVGLGGKHHFDGVLFDLGVSSRQLDTPARGFSFRSTGPLDMRMGPGARRTAADIVNAAQESELADIFYYLGEERHSRRIARSIVRERLLTPFRTTDQLADTVRRAVPKTRSRIDPATRVFQALRIAVNDELDRLRAALPQALSLLRPSGRLVVITFHSLEDRIVKQFMQAEARGCICPPDLPECVCGRSPTVRIITKRPIRADAEEIRNNPRSRSAKLRAAEAIT